MDLGGGSGNGSNGNGAANGSARRLDAIKLAKVNKWEELRRLVDAEPLTAQQTDSYGMLPLHWACTEPHAIGEGVLMALLKAFPAGARVANTAEMLPLQIAIKAQAKIEWLQALLASYPDAVLHKTPTGEHAVELAKKANLPARSVRLLEEMYLHVCQKAGYSSDHLYEDEGDHSSSAAATAAAGQNDNNYADHATISSLRAVDSAEAALAMASNGSSRGGAPLTMAARGSRRPSNPDAYKGRAYSSDNDFMGGQDTMAPSYVRGVSTSSNGSGSGGSGGGSMSMHPGVALSKPLPYQVSTRLSSRTVVSLPPRWKNAPNCYICSQKWSTPFRKRHHCRNCGESICGDHSARERMKLPHYGLPDKYRVCTVCHQSLRNAPNELLQPSQGRLTQGVGARRSDEMMPQRGSAGSMNLGGRGANGSMNSGGGGNFQLERHVSAPARPMMMDTEYHGIHDQVASLQLKVSQLMEEKEKAESQLRVQAEMLGEPYQSSDPRFTSGNGANAGGMGRRTRLNSVPVTLPSNGYGSAAAGGQMPPAAPSSYGGQSAFYSYDGASQLRSTNSSDREVDIDYGAISMSSAVPEPPTSTESGPIDAMAQLQEDLGSMSFVSSYSEFDDRSTGVFDDMQSPMAFSSGVLEEGEEEDDDGDVGDSTLPEVEVLVNLGLSMLNKGSASAAVQAFTRAIEICPDTAVLYSYVAKAHYADDNLDDAVDALEKSLELEPSAANSTLLGKILFEKGDHEKAIEAYQKSLTYQK